MTMKKIIYSLLLASGLLSTSCNDYLDVVPKGDVETIETNFEQRNDVDNGSKLAMPMFTNMATSYDEQPGFFGADEFVAGQYSQRQHGGIWTCHRYRKWTPNGTKPILQHLEQRWSLTVSYAIATYS